jgi:hypothetical protein
MKIVSKLLVGFGAAYFCVLVLAIASFPLLIIGATTAPADRLPAYSVGLVVFTVALGIVFFVCISAKRIIEKM